MSRIFFTLVLMIAATNTLARTLSEHEMRELLATSPVFEEREEQTVQWTLFNDGQVAAFSRWLLWTFSIQGSWQFKDGELCVTITPPDEAVEVMCGRFTHLEANRYRFDEDDGEQIELFLISSIDDAIAGD